MFNVPSFFGFRSGSGGIFAAYAARVAADGGVTEAGACVNAVSGISLNSSLLLVPSGYKSGVVYSEIPTNGDGDLTFTRASDATRVNSDGEIEVVGSGVPRLDYSQGSCPALLLEPQRTNTILRSQDLSNASWTKTNVTITANAITSPIASFNADAIVENSGTNTVFGFNAASRPSGLTLGTTYSVSFFAKKITRDWCYFNDFNQFQTPRVLVFFNLSTGLVGTSGIGVLNPKMENYGNGWYKCSFQFVAGGAGVSMDYRIASATTDNTLTYLGTIGQESISVTACQLEQGAYATSYIPTTSATVTRLADFCSKTGISSLIGQTEGTLFVEWENKNNDLCNLIETYNASSNITGTSSILIQKSSNNQFNIRVFDSLGNYSDVFFATIPLGSNKVALAYQSGSAVLYLNGVSIGSNSRTYVFVSTRDVISFDNRGAYSRSQALLFTTRLSNAELASITTL